MFISNYQEYQDLELFSDENILKNLWVESKYSYGQWGKDENNILYRIYFISKFKLFGVFSTIVLKQYKNAHPEDFL